MLVYLKTFFLNNNYFKPKQEEEPVIKHKFFRVIARNKQEKIKRVEKQYTQKRVPYKTLKK